ncbi:MAG: hypothetical protein U1F53_21570 [Burkholderiaceae bacterium]
MTAVYHQHVFGDHSLDATALAWQRRCTVTLLTALDLPWQADGLQRDGAHVREPVDAAVRGLLVGAGLPFIVVGGLGEARLEAAVDAVAPCSRSPALLPPACFSCLAERDAVQPAWRWVCENCDLPDREHASLRQRRQRYRARARLAAGPAPA